MSWQLLVLSLPTQNATARMRAWRALKACGAAVLRDGVYALPDGDGHRRTLAVIQQNIVFALGVKLLFIGLAATGMATLWMAIAADMGATLLVTFNGLRMLRSKV